MNRSKIFGDEKFKQTVLWLILFLFSCQFVHAANWHNNFHMQFPVTINKIVCRDATNRQVFAVGDAGFFARSEDYGYTWQFIPTPTSENLYSIEVTYDPDTLLVAVGGSGTVLFSNDLGTSWNAQTVGGEILNVVAFDSTRFWIAGLNRNAIFSSADGTTWIPSQIIDGIMDITALANTRYGLRAAGFSANTTHLLEYNIGNDQFLTYHTEADVRINSGVQIHDQLVFAGINLVGGSGALLLASDVLVNWSTPILTLPPALGTEIIAVNGFFDLEPVMWVSLSDGTVHESVDQGFTFNPVFNHDTGGIFRSIAVKASSAPARLAWLAGDMGRLALLGMGPENSIPSPNGFMMAAENRIQLRFSGIPSLSSVENGIKIFSTIKGAVPFTASYNLADSLEVELLLQEGTVPGEIWKVIISEEVREIITSLPSGGFIMNINGKPFGPGDFNFGPPDTTLSTGNVCTNVVSGFFNDDDIFDLVTFSQGNLYCFAGDGTGDFLPGQTIPIGPVATIDGNAESIFDNQLVSVDLNRDGLLDLILYDQSIVNVLTNQSTSVFNFALTNNQPASNLVSIKPFAFDLDSTMDLLVVGDQIESRTQVSDAFFGNIRSNPVNPGWEKIRIGDIDRDGTEDFAALRNDHSVSVRRNLPWGGFDTAFVIPGNFDRMDLADMNSDGYLDIVTGDRDIIQIYAFSPPWNFSSATTLSQADSSSIADLNIFDFTGNDFNDIVIFTMNDQLKVFQNQGGFSFFERIDQNRTFGLQPTGVVRGDYNQDGQIDLAAFDVRTGVIQTILNGSSQPWRPYIDSTRVTNNQVQLSWSSYPDPAALAFYRVYRDTLPGTTNFHTDVTTNFYTDTTVQQGLTYFYKVEAYDTLLSPSPISDEVAVSVYQTLSGLISGVLADTTVPYLVTGHLEVDQGRLLQIMPGVKLLFEPAADFTVFGRLEVMGSPDHFVSFSAIDEMSTWPGIVLSGLGDQDTIRMSWFDIRNADQALRIEDRPARIQYAGINNNTIGIIVRFSPNGYLHAENIMIARNQTGIQVSNFASVYLKNVTISQNMSDGILANNFTNFNIKNSIIWENNNFGPSIRNSTAIAINIRYSTIDSLSGAFSTTRVSRLAPVFIPANMDSMEFVPDTLSPTIDWGDPLDDFSQEPLPNGGRINQGVYGGTPFAMTTHQPRITVSLDTVGLAARVSSTDSRPLTITNTGNRDLRINNIFTSAAQFNATAVTPRILTPGSNYNIGINFTPDARTNFSDILRIDNNDPHYPLPGYTVTLQGTGLNTAPQITTPVLINGVQNTAYIDTVRATDFDNDPVTFSALARPTWMTINANGSISGIPSNADVGTLIPVQIRASDGQNGFDTLSTTISVLNVNDSPIITTVSLSNAIEDAAYIDTVRAVDIDNDVLQFTAVNVPSWLTVASNGALSGTPVNADVANNIPVVIRVSDGNGAYDTLSTQINVINTNDPPQITLLSDTVAYALIPFDFTVPWFDIDPFDTLTFSDNTPLFDIDPQSGQIQFTPDLSDTGRYAIEIGVSDGIVYLSDVFNLDIELAPLNAPFAVSVASGDQSLTLTWTNPGNLFPTGTVISISKVNPVSHPDSGTIVYDDTTLAENAVVTATLTGLEIGQTYYISLFTYIDAGVRIYSDPFQTVAMTQESLLNFDYSDRHRFVPPGRTLFDSLLVKNDGAGTLVFRFSYTRNIFLDRWFDMDTTQHSIAPFDSMRVAFQMHPPDDLPDLPYSVTVHIDDNDPLDGPAAADLVMHLLYDRVAPQLSVLSQPDSIHRFSAMRFNFTANDTVELFGWKIGYPTDSLRVHYKFFEMTLTGARLLSEQSDIPIQPLDFYPLPDGDYKFELWVYDPDSNGVAAIDIALRKLITIAASEIILPAKRWYLVSFPREQDVPIHTFVNDSTARVFRWDNKTQRYHSFGDSTLKAGQGVWVLSHTQRKFDVSPLPVTQNLDSIEIQLQQGWNQIGVPAGYYIDFGALLYRPEGLGVPLSMEEAITQKKLAPAVYWYTSGVLNQGYEWAEIWKTAGQPWRGYWVLAAQAGDLIISRNPVFPDNSTDAADVSGDDINAVTKISASEWQLSLTLTNATHRDAGNIIGISSREQGLPVYEPPPLDDFCSAYFNSADGRITRDLRVPFDSIDDVKEWQLYVSSSGQGKMHALSWHSWDNGNGVYIYLVDNQAEQIINLSVQSEYTFKMNSGTRRFTIYATQNASFEPKIIPEEFRLLQNFPNPFNPVTTIRFGVPDFSNGERIQLKIFNVLGQEIITLLDQNMEAGYHEVVWDGRGVNGTHLSSGIYFYQLIGGGNQLARKLILLK